MRERVKLGVGPAISESVSCVFKEMRRHLRVSVNCQRCHARERGHPWRRASQLAIGRAGSRQGAGSPLSRPGPTVGAPSDASHLDFLRPTRACIGAPRIPGFCPVGIVWNSLDSLVRNEPFQWVTRDPGPILFFWGALSPGRRRKARPSSIRRSTTLNLLAGRKWLGKSRSMAGDFARVRSGIATKLTPSSLFGKKLSTRRAFLQNLGGRSRARRSPQLHRRAPASGARRGPRGPFGRR